MTKSIQRPYTVDVIKNESN